MKQNCSECPKPIIRGKGKFRKLAAKTCGKRCARARKTRLQRQSRKQGNFLF